MWHIAVNLFSHIMWPHRWGVLMKIDQKTKNWKFPPSPEQNFTQKVFKMTNHNFVVNICDFWQFWRKTIENGLKNQLKLAKYSWTKMSHLKTTEQLKIFFSPKDVLHSLIESQQVLLASADSYPGYYDWEQQMKNLRWAPFPSFHSFHPCETEVMRKITKCCHVVDLFWLMVMNLPITWCGLRRVK